MSRTLLDALIYRGQAAISLDIAIFLPGNSARKENIVELSYESADARVRAIGGTSAEHLSSFVTWLGGQQYSAGYVCIVARHALAFGRWCEGRGIELDALTDDGIETIPAQSRPAPLTTRRDAPPGTTSADPAAALPARTRDLRCRCCAHDGC